jgi:hypothetical protein
MAVAALAGCGGRARELPPPLPATVLPELDARDRDLPPEALGADAFDTDALARLLDEARYQSGRERELSGHTDTFDHVIARTLRFEDGAGARVYLEWIDGHTIDLVGRTRARDPLPIGEDARLFELEPCSTCKKQQPTYVAAWRRGDVVGYVLASGRDADRVSILPLAAAVDRSLGAGS